MNFETDEATGEPLPVQKEANATFPEDTRPGDRLNVIFGSSTVTKGRGRGVVFATGMTTEIGSIAVALRSENPKRRAVKCKPDGSAKPHRYVELGVSLLRISLDASLEPTLEHPCRENFRN
jgi:Na+-exporting ATPase